MTRRALLLLTAIAAALTLGAGAAMAVVPAGDATTTTTNQDNTTQQGGSTSSGVHTEAAVQQLVASWGDNIYGQLGNGTTGGSSSTPVPVSDDNGGVLQDVTAISAGRSHSLALESNQTVVAWGFNSVGQLGNGTTGGSTCDCSNTPVAVINLSGVKAIAAGGDFDSGNHSLALKTDGTVRSWGANDSGQLGNGTTGGGSCNCSNTPVKVSNLSGVTGIAVGGYHSLAK